MIGTDDPTCDEPPPRPTPSSDEPQGCGVAVLLLCYQGACKLVMYSSLARSLPPKNPFFVALQH